MLSTPPAFNLSQNQTLQFKSVAKISVGRKSESQSSFPFAIHLSMNHTDPLGAKQLFTPLRFRCQQVFSFRESFFFAAPSGQLVGARETYVSFSNPRQELFCHPENFFPVALSDVASSLARTALCAFSTPPSSIFPQKSKKCFQAIKKALPRRESLIFNPLGEILVLSAKNVKYFILFFMQYEGYVTIHHFFQHIDSKILHKKSPFRGRGPDR